MTLPLRKVEKPAFSALYSVGRGKLVAAYEVREDDVRPAVTVGAAKVSPKLFFEIRGSTTEALDDVVMARFDPLYEAAIETLGLDASKILDDYFMRRKLYELDLGGQVAVLDGEVKFDDTIGLWTLRFFPVLEKLEGLRGRILKTFTGVGEYHDDDGTYRRGTRKPGLRLNGTKRSGSCEGQGSVAMLKGLRKRVLETISNSATSCSASPPTSLGVEATTTPTES